jgi:hypothetical protein
MLENPTATGRPVNGVRNLTHSDKTAWHSALKLVVSNDIDFPNLVGRRHVDTFDPVFGTYPANFLKGGIDIKFDLSQFSSAISMRY